MIVDLEILIHHRLELENLALQIFPEEQRTPYVQSFVSIPEKKNAHTKRTKHKVDKKYRFSSSWCEIYLHLKSCGLLFLVSLGHSNFPNALAWPRFSYSFSSERKLKLRVEFVLHWESPCRPSTRFHCSTLLLQSKYICICSHLYIHIYIWSIETREQCKVGKSPRYRFELWHWPQQQCTWGSC